MSSFGGISPARMLTCTDGRMSTGISSVASRAVRIFTNRENRRHLRRGSVCGRPGQTCWSRPQRRSWARLGAPRATPAGRSRPPAGRQAQPHQAGRPGCDRSSPALGLTDDGHRTGPEHRGDAIPDQDRVFGEKNSDRGVALMHALTVIAVPPAQHRRWLNPPVGRIRTGASATPRAPRNRPNRQTGLTACNAISAAGVLLFSDRIRSCLASTYLPPTMRGGRGVVHRGGVAVVGHARAASRPAACGPSMTV